MDEEKRVREREKNYYSIEKFDNRKKSNQRTNKWMNGRKERKKETKKFFHG